MPVTWTQEEIDKLKAAIATGVKEVTYDGPPRRQVVYHSLEEMRDLLASMTAAVDAEAGTPAYRLGATRKGL